LTLYLKHKLSLLLMAIVSVTFINLAINVRASTTDAPTVTLNEPLQTDPNTRNYLPTGTEALYTKIPNQKDAKISVKATDLKSVATTADQGQTYFRGYRVAQTSDGKFYLKVVSFNKAYRGWIYVGNNNPSSDTTSVTNGLTSVQTFKEETPSDTVAKTTFYFTTPKASTLTYTAPDWTQYKVGRNLNATTAYVNDALKVTQIGTKQNNRDNNATYYYVEDSANPQVNGWIKSSEVSAVKQTFNY